MLSLYTFKRVQKNTDNSFYCDHEISWDNHPYRISTIQTQWRVLFQIGGNVFVFMKDGFVRIYTIILS